MGIGLNASDKRRVIGHGSVIVSDMRAFSCDYSVLSVDGCAWFRRVVSRNSRVSVYDAVRLFFLPSLIKIGINLIFICFDDVLRIPEMRERFYSLRRYKGGVESGSDIDFSLIDLHSMPCSWSEAWDSSVGKQYLWRAIESGIRQCLSEGRGGEGIRYIIDGPDSEIFYHPPLGRVTQKYRYPCGLHCYGEGDFKSLEGCRWLVGVEGKKGMVLTIDWDVPFMSCVSYDRAIDVVVGSVFCEKAKASGGVFFNDGSGGVELSATGKKKLREGVSCYEVVKSDYVCARMKLSGIRTKYYLFFVLSCGSCDYSLSLVRFGYGVSDVIEFLERAVSLDYAGCDWFEDGDGVFLFYPYRFLNGFLRVVKRKKNKKDDMGEFVEELWSMLWTVGYFHR